jgi:hypothetical protein
LVAALVLAAGLLLPQIVDRAPVVYEAEAQVGPNEVLRLDNTDSLPKLGESVFGKENGAVARAVRKSLRLPDSTEVIPNRVELVAAQDNIVFVVVGRGPDVNSAERTANVAAAQFTDELNKYAEPVGTWAIQDLAAANNEPVARISGLLAGVGGVLAGLILAVGAVALLLVARRPVIDTAAAEDATGAPGIAHVTLGHDGTPSRGLPRLCRHILSSGTEVLLLVGPSSTTRARHELAVQLTGALRRSRNAEVAREPDEDTRPVVTPRQEPARQGDLVILEDPSLVNIANRPERSLTLLVVPEGIGQSSLRQLAEQYLDGGAAGVVLIRRTGGDGLRSSTKRGARSSQTVPRAIAPGRSTGSADGLNSTA